MTKHEESRAILQALGLPVKQQNVMSGYALLALAGLKAEMPWSAAASPLMGVRPIIRFITDEYGQPPYDREGIRRQVLHQFEEHRVIDANPDQPRPTNSGKSCYALTAEALGVIRSFGTAGFAEAASGYTTTKMERLERYRRVKRAQIVPVELAPGVTAFLSAGGHNELQADVIRYFYPNFIPNAKLIYLGDTANRIGPPFKDDTSMAKAGIPYSEHDKFPDVVFFWE